MIKAVNISHGKRSYTSIWGVHTGRYSGRYSFYKFVKCIVDSPHVINPCIDCLTLSILFMLRITRMVLVTDLFCCLSSSFLIVMYSLSLWQIPVFTGPVHNHQDVLLSFQSIMAAGSSIMPRGTKACVKILTSRFYSWPMRTWNRSFSLSP